MQWMSAAVGGITGELVSKNPQLGKSTSSNGTKNNDVAVDLSMLFLHSSFILLAIHWN